MATAEKAEPDDSPGLSPRNTVYSPPNHVDTYFSNMSGTGVAINECGGKPLKYDVDLQRLLATSLGELDARRVVCRRKVTAVFRKRGGGMCGGGGLEEEMLRSEHATTCVDFGFAVISVGEPPRPPNTHTPPRL